MFNFENCKYYITNITTFFLLQVLIFNFITCDENDSKSRMLKTSPPGDIQNPFIYLAGFVQIERHNEGALEANYKCLWFIA